MHVANITAVGAAALEAALTQWVAMQAAEVRDACTGWASTRPLGASMVGPCLYESVTNSIVHYRLQEHESSCSQGG